MITPENIDEIEKRAYGERNRLMDEEQLGLRQSWLIASATIARSMDMEPEAFRHRLKTVRQDVRWNMLKDGGFQKSLAQRPSWQTQPRLFEAILRILFEHDPIRICDHDSGAIEYATEVNTILPRLERCTSAAEVSQVIFEEFNRWFGPDPPRPLDYYGAIADDIWTIMINQ